MTDDLELVKIDDYGNLMLAENMIKYNKLKNTFESDTLKKKVIDELDNQEHDDPNSDDEMTEKKPTYYPESKYYILDDTQDETDDVYDDVLFTFNKNGDDTIIQCLDRTLNVNSNYDTFIFNNYTKSTLMTIECNEKLSYRVLIDITGLIKLNIIGSVQKTYTIEMNNNELVFKRIKYNKNFT